MGTGAGVPSGAVGGDGGGGGGGGGAESNVSEEGDYEPACGYLVFGPMVKEKTISVRVCTPSGK